MNSQEFVIDYTITATGKIPIVTHVLNFKDRFDNWKARWAIRRMNYVIEPGLYAIGSPQADSPVLVSANYRLSFDSLRKELPDFDAWILILDTRGINVWCAAGKGTFGTEELINKIQQVQLDKIVSHRQLILPQLGAPGVAAHLVKEATGFNVIFGPIRAADLKSFIDAGYKAAPEMRLVRFNILDRLQVIPVEFIQGFTYLLPICLIFFLLSGFDATGYSSHSLRAAGFISIISLIIAYVSGTLLTPLLLPFIPGRSFAFKGFLSIIPISIMLYSVFPRFQDLSTIEMIAWFLLMSSISSFLALNFTGDSTYTSLSGVKKEMKIAVPLQIIGFVVGFILWIISRFI